jgi:hypothetical protein
MPDPAAVFASHDDNRNLHGHDSPLAIVADDFISYILRGYQLTYDAVVLYSNVMNQAIDLIVRAQ